MNQSYISVIPILLHNKIIKLYNSYIDIHIKPVKIIQRVTYLIKLTNFIMISQLNIKNNKPGYSY